MFHQGETNTTTLKRWRCFTPTHGKKAFSELPRSPVEKALSRACERHFARWRGAGTPQRRLHFRNKGAVAQKLLARNPFITVAFGGPRGRSEVPKTTPATLAPQPARFWAPN